MENLNNIDINNLLPVEAGGDKKECEILNNLGKIVECQSQDIGKDIVKQ